MNKRRWWKAKARRKYLAHYFNSGEYLRAKLVFNLMARYRADR